MNIFEDSVLPPTLNLRYERFKELYGEDRPTHEYVAFISRAMKEAHAAGHESVQKTTYDLVIADHDKFTEFVSTMSR